MCLLPYVQGEVTHYRSPLKLYEYLATGKPIVSTEHPEVNEFGHVVTIAPRSQFGEAVEFVLQKDSLENQRLRMKIARENSWDARVDAMQNILKKHLH